MGDRDAFPYLDGFLCSHSILRAMAQVGGFRLSDAAEALRFRDGAEPHERNALSRLEQLWGKPTKDEESEIVRIANTLREAHERLAWGQGELPEVAK